MYFINTEVNVGNVSYEFGVANNPSGDSTSASVYEKGAMRQLATKPGSLKHQTVNGNDGIRVDVQHEGNRQSITFFLDGSKKMATLLSVSDTADANPHKERFLGSFKVVK